MTTIPNLSFQLYSARFEPSLDAKLAELAGLGYGMVEPYGGLYADLDALRAGLDAHGLRAPTGHFNFGDIRADAARVVAIATALKMEVVVVSALPKDEREKDLDGWKAVARDLAAHARRFTDAGFGFAWHNHAFEFVELEDGSMPLDHLLACAPEMQWQVDIGWVVRGGQDPDSLFKEYGERVFSIHLKDLAPDGECLDEDGWADVGHGVFDWSIWWPRLTRLAPKLHVVEHDKPTDYRRFARRSAETFRRLSRQGD